MLRREFLQLAKVFDSKKHGIAGWLVSEKLDGQRCFGTVVVRGAC